jgi:hypothetical protein
MCSDHSKFTSGGSISNHAYGRGLDIASVDGEVQVVGPGGVRFSFTPEAAAETSDRLMFGAAEAQGQKIQKAERLKPRR